MSWRDSIAQNTGAASIADVNQYLVSTVQGVASPLDTFYTASKELLRVGTPPFLTDHPAMGPLLLVGLVSVTENYFRDLFSRLIHICPMARAKAADQPIRLGSAIWHGGQDAARGAFDHISFAGAENLRSTAAKFLGYQIDRTTAETIIEEFDKVCELRHGIVHSSAMLAGKNAIRLQVSATRAPLRIVVGFAELQECAAICTSLVVTLNKELFVEMCRRWATVWPKRPAWNPADRHTTFKQVWLTFHSAADDAAGTIPTRMTLIRCRNGVAQHPF